MKKLVLVVCLLVASLAARAQFEQGKWIINPGFMRRIRWFCRNFGS